MNVAGAIEQHIESANLGGAICNVARVADIEPAGADVRPLFTEGREQLLVDVGGPDRSAFVGKCDRGGTSNALSRSRSQRNFPRKSSANFKSLDLKASIARD